MAKKIVSKIIGNLEQDHQFKDWWTSNNISIPFFNNEKMRVTFIGYEPANNSTFLEEADYALENFLALKNSDRDAVSDFIYKNCSDILNKKNILHSHTIWDFLEPMNIYISCKNKDNYKINLLIDCEIIENDDLLLVFKEGKSLTRISQYKLEVY